MTPEGREGDVSYRRSNGLGEKGGEPFSASFWSLVETRGTTMQVERQHQDRRMTKSTGWVQNN